MDVVLIIKNYGNKKSIFDFLRKDHLIQETVATGTLCKKIIWNHRRKGFRSIYVRRDTGTELHKWTFTE